MPIAVSGRRVLVSCGDTLYGLAANDGHVVWSLTRTGLFAGAAGVSQSLAQVSFTTHTEASTAPGLQLAVDVRSGAVRWEVSVPNSVYGFYDAPAVAGGLVVTCTERRSSAGPGQLTARAVDTGEVVWQVTPGHCTDVAISRGGVYTGWMTSFDLATGAPLLAFTPHPAPLIHGPGSPPAIGGRELYFQNSASVTPFTAAFSQKTGAQRWNVRCCGLESAASSAGLAGGVAWVLGDNGYLNGLDVANGDRIYSQFIRPSGFNNSGLGTVGPIVSHGFLVVDAFGPQVFSVPRG
jgi:outer membrane protein assembly factor BamB